MPSGCDMGGTDVNTPDGWQLDPRRTDVSLLSLPHFNPLQEAGASQYPSVSHPPFHPLPRDPVNLQVLQAFVDCHEFANLNLVQALR